MKESLAKEFPVRGVDQRVRSQNLLQRGKRPAGSKQQSATREFHSLFLRSGFEPADRGVGKAPCLSLHSRNKLACLPEQHFLRSVIRLAEFISESLDELNSLPREHHRQASIHAHRDSRRPSPMHAKPKRCLF